MKAQKKEFETNFIKSLKDRHVVSYAPKGAVAKQLGG